MTALWNYWHHAPLAGVLLKGETSYATDKTDVENGVLDYTALLVEQTTYKTTYFGTYRVGAGTSIMVVDGFTPKGPLVVYEAQTYQMTWSQWRNSNIQMWGLNTYVPGTSTTTTIPTGGTTTSIPSNSDYGPQGENFPTYGNVYPADLGDCTFAAAADWEQIVLGAHPDQSLIGYEFAEAGGTATGGLSVDGLFSFWQNQGIAGVQITGYSSYYTDPVDVENGVRDYTALLVEFQFISGDYLGNQQVPVGYHMAVVDGFDPEGPIVVTWGQTIQMSWDQWNAEVVAMFGVTTT